MTDTITLREFELLNTSTEPRVAVKREKISKDFKEKVRIRIVRKVNKDLEFDLIGVDPSLANAFRRIMLSDVPSMAIEKVYIYNNTSIIQDEVLAHRLGLIPLKADPRNFQFPEPESEGKENNTLEFELKIRCSRKKNVNNHLSNDSDDLYENHRVFTKDMKWIPKGDQGKRMSEADVRPVDDDILIAKMRPGHELDLKLLAVKGTGRDHAKFSPVCTAFYRLLPKIELKSSVTGEAAKRLQSCFSPGVIGIDDEKKAFVKESRYDMCSRNVFRHEDLKDAVILSKIKDHFIFTVESAGALEPEDIFIQSVDILIDKCDYFLKKFEADND